MKSAGTQVGFVPLSRQFQERLGKRVDPASFSITKRFIGGGGAVGFALLTLIVMRTFPPPPFLTGFFTISIGLWIAMFLFVVLSSCFDSKAGVARYRREAELTWFTQVSFLKPSIGIAIAVLATALGAFSFFTVITGLIRNGGNVWAAAPRSAWIFGLTFLILSVYAWRELFRTLRANYGIRLAPDRVGICHEHEDLFLYWKQIENVTVEMVNKGTDRRKNVLPCVRIEVTGSQIYHVTATELGSDVNVVAALLQYYLTHPQERHLLANPEEAIRRFSEAQAEV